MNEPLYGKQNELWKLVLVLVSRRETCHIIMKVNRLIYKIQ